MAKYMLSFFPIFFLVGCITQNVRINAFSGEDHESSSVAYIKPQWGLIIHSINGVNYDLKTNGGYIQKDYEIALLPGDYEISLALETQGIKSNGQISVRFTALPGRKYLVLSKQNYDTRTWNPHIEDMTENEKCWSTNVGFIFGPSGC